MKFCISILLLALVTPFCLSAQEITGSRAQIRQAINDAQWVQTEYRKLVIEMRDLAYSLESLQARCNSEDFVLADSDCNTQFTELEARKDLLDEWQAKVYSKELDCKLILYQYHRKAEREFEKMKSTNSDLERMMDVLLELEVIEVDCRLDEVYNSLVTLRSLADVATP